ncbi:MAG: glycosyltransferase family 39 protein [Myxococcota bacterium]|nr:glycosyltransferase family 39 protein [Myxococcota bacterium]
MKGIENKIPIAVIVVLGLSNLVASSLVGLGDAEALYYCYGKHPSLSYLDHPPLIGWLLFVATWALGTSVFSVRIVSFAMCALAVLFMTLLTRTIYGQRAANWSCLLLLGTPIFSVGMIAATPDAPLTVLWIIFTWQLYCALRHDRVTAWTQLGRPTLLGCLLGLSFLAKYTGACLIVTVLIIVSRPQGRMWLRRPGFWLGVLAAAVVASPVFIWNIDHAWAGAYHRLVWTQTSSGLSLRNAGALLGGQALYIGVPMLVIFCWAGIRTWQQRGRHSDPLLLLYASLPALAATYGLVLWSPVAEPHWPAAGYLPLFVAAAGAISASSAKIQQLARVAVGLGIMALLILQLLVLTPILPFVTPQALYQPKYDLANELQGWPEVAETIRKLNGDRNPVVAAFYTQCSQLTFALSNPGDPPVRCVSKEVDDFDLWHGPLDPNIDRALFVTDNRFDHDPKTVVPGLHPMAETVVPIHRAGRVVRQFRIIELKRPEK